MALLNFQYLSIDGCVKKLPRRLNVEYLRRYISFRTFVGDNIRFVITPKGCPNGRFGAEIIDNLIPTGWINLFYTLIYKHTLFANYHDRIWKCAWVIKSTFYRLFVDRRCRWWLWSSADSPFMSRRSFGSNNWHEVSRKHRKSTYFSL